jgi:hypothetical protein
MISRKMVYCGLTFNRRCMGALMVGLLLSGGLQRQAFSHGMSHPDFSKVHSLQGERLLQTKEQIGHH